MEGDSGDDAWVSTGLAWLNLGAGRVDAGGGCAVVRVFSQRHTSAELLQFKHQAGQAHYQLGARRGSTYKGRL
jgi:hypothetical protein